MKRREPRIEDTPPRWASVVLAVLVALFIVLATGSMLSESQTSDEAIHLAAGYAHLTRGDFELNPEHPPLAKEIAALPLLFMNVELPVDDPSWRTAHGSAFQLPLGERFLYHNKIPFTRILSAGRLPVVVLGAWLCLVVNAFSRRLFGWRAGLLSTGLCALCPNVLANSRLVTTDLAVSLFFLTSLLCLHRYLEDPSRRNLAFTGVSTGLCLATKFSAVILVPSLLVVMLMVTTRSRSRGWTATATRSFAAMLGIALATLAATYGFLHLPTYFSGLAGVFSTVSGGSEAFLLGSHSERGWWYYYPVAMALKTPLPALILFTLIPLAHASPSRSGGAGKQLVLLIPLALFMASSLAAARNVGVRHVLPVYPILFVLAGQILAPGGLFDRLPDFTKWSRRLAIAALALWYAGAAFATYPGYLAYFNELGGGPAEGWRLLSDSNIDWGQDFFRLKQYMMTQGVEEILLAHYGNQDPAYYGISYQYLPGAGHIKPPPTRVQQSERVLVGISVMTLQGMFLRDRDLYRWLQEREPAARAGGSILIYDVTSDAGAYRALASIYERARMLPQAEWARRRGAAVARGQAPDGRFPVEGRQGSQ